jgi:FxsC-like protein
MQSVPSIGAPPTVHPVFFVSRAGPGEGDGLFERFFADLRRCVAARLDLPDDPDLGFAVEPTSSPRRLAQALAVCRVFVPLWSPPYFTDARCGKAWTVFEGRVKALGGPCPERYFAPVTWKPVSPGMMPYPARAVDRADGRDERPEEARGLHALMSDAFDEPTDRRESKAGGGEPLYRRVVDGVADAVADSCREPLGPTEPADLDRARNAFAKPRPSLGLRVVILAPTSGRLPEGRSGKGRYGPGPLDWAPYGDRPLAEEVALVTEGLCYQLDLVAFDEVSRDLLSPGAAAEAEPTLLLIDNWSLLDAERRRQVDAYARPDRLWHRFMVVRDPEDPETRLHLARLQAVVDETLLARLEELPVDLEHAASGRSTRPWFAHNFSALARAAASSYIRR